MKTNFDLGMITMGNIEYDILKRMMRIMGYVLLCSLNIVVRLLCQITGWYTYD